jgi:putative spermidine/putrescine transport system substrate-binding protein
MKTKPELGIKNPYALDDTQFKAATDLLTEQNKLIGEYWSDYTKEVQAFKAGNSVLGTTWQIITNLAQADKAPVEAILPSEGATGHDLVEVQAPELRLPLDEPHHLAQGQRRGRRVVR